MQLTVAAQDDRIFQVELDDSETLSTLQAILEAESGTPAAQQQLVHNARPLPASATGQTLSALGIANGDMLMLLEKPPAGAAGAQQQQGRQQQQQPAAANPHMALAEDGSARAPAAFIQSVKASAQTMAQLSGTHPSLATAIRNDDITAVQVCVCVCLVTRQLQERAVERASEQASERVVGLGVSAAPASTPHTHTVFRTQDELRAIRRQQLAEQEALRREEELLAADPFDPDAQRKIEELIHKRNVEENFASVGAYMGGLGRC